MPTYALKCEACGFDLDEQFLSMAERDDAYCPECGCCDELANDYTRHETSNFQLTGSDWPGKTNRLESFILKDRS